MHRLWCLACGYSEAFTDSRAASELRRRLYFWACTFNLGRPLKLVKLMHGYGQNRGLHTGWCMDTIVHPWSTLMQYGILT